MTVYLVVLEGEILSAWETELLAHEHRVIFAEIVPLDIKGEQDRYEITVSCDV
jgi:hypothetical protein